MNVSELDEFHVVIPIILCNCLKSDDLEGEAAGCVRDARTCVTLGGTLSPNSTDVVRCVIESRISDYPPRWS
jgi:hypothetical protein